MCARSPRPQRTRKHASPASCSASTISPRKHARVRCPGARRCCRGSRLACSAAREYGLDILDGVYNDIGNTEGFPAECAQARDMGFDGKTLIHPNQIEPCNAAFSPAAEEVAQARKMIAAFDRPENRDKGVVQIDGRMVERMHAEMARRTVAIAEAIAARELIGGRRMPQPAKLGPATKRSSARPAPPQAAPKARSPGCSPSPSWRSTISYIDKSVVNVATANHRGLICTHPPRSCSGWSMPTCCRSPRSCWWAAPPATSWAAAAYLSSARRSSPPRRCGAGYRFPSQPLIVARAVQRRGRGSTHPVLARDHRRDL